MVRALYRLVDRNSVVESYKEDVPKIDVCIIRARLIEIPALKGSDPASPGHPQRHQASRLARFRIQVPREVPVKLECVLCNQAILANGPFLKSAEVHLYLSASTLSYANDFHSPIFIQQQLFETYF